MEISQGLSERHPWLALPKYSHPGRGASMSGVIIDIGIFGSLAVIVIVIGLKIWFGYRADQWIEKDDSKTTDKN
jgi:hypothetical protein